MTTTIASDTDQVVHLRVSWEAYDALVSSVGDDTGSLISYDEGILEIMSPGSRHERIAKRITYLLSAVVTEWQVDLEETGSTTFRKIGERQIFSDRSAARPRH